MKTNARCALIVWLLGAVAALPGCFETTKPRPADPGEGSIQALGPDGKPRLTQSQLSSLVRGFADRYAEVCNQALDEIKSKVGTARARTVAQGRKAFGAASVYAIAARPNAEVALLDMVVQVTVEREIYTRGVAERVFGEHSVTLEQAYDKLDAEVWALARRVFTEEQLGELRDAVEEWIVNNPDQRYLGFVQVENFAEFRQKSALGSLGTPGGLSMLAPINEATRAADEIRLLGERALFLAQRMPALVEAQAQLLVYDTLGQEEVVGALSGMSNLSASLDSVAASIDSLPEVVAKERATAIETAAQMLAQERGAAIRELSAVFASERDAIFKEIDDAAHEVRGTLSDVRASIEQAGPLATDAKEAAGALRDALASVDQLLGEIDAGAPEGGTLRLEDASAALQELSATLRETRALLESGGWKDRVRDVDDAASRRITHAGLWGAGLIVLFFGCLLGYRALAGRLPMKPGA